MGDRPRSPGLDVLEWRGKSVTWMKLVAHMMHIFIKGHCK
jgi:hypothetical protein